MAIPSPEGMTHDEFKLALLSSLESELTGTLVEIDKRLREAKVLIEGYRMDPIVGYVAVKLDFLRSLRPEGDKIKEAHNTPGLAAYAIIEELFAGIPGYIVVTDAELRHEDFGYDGDDDRPGISIKTTLNIEHTYVLKDGKYVCEWGDPANPIHQGEPLAKKKPQRQEFIDRNGMPTIQYNL